MRHLRVNLLLRYCVWLTLVTGQLGWVAAGQLAPRNASAPPAPATAPKEATAAVSLTPAVLMARGSMGQSMTRTLTISNQTSMPFKFEMVAQDIIVRDGKRVFVPAGETPGSVAASAVFSRKQVEVAPGQSASVDVTLTLPDATPVRAVVAIFRGLDKVPAQSGAVMMTASLGCLITFTVSENFSVESESIEIAAPTDSRPMRLEEFLRNSGTEPVVVEGVVALLSSSGSLVGKATFQPQRLLPGERLPFRTEYSSALPPGQYRALTTFQFEGKLLTQSAEFTVP